MAVNTWSASPPATASEPAAVWQAVVRTVAYADVFDFPVSVAEVHRFLHGIRATGEVVTGALAHCSEPGGPLSHRDGFYTLRGREHLSEVRRSREVNADRLWPAAVWYGRLLAKLPFVRMVAITGSLAWDNVNDNGDIDYLVVTEPDRLWVCRWLIAAVVRIARLGGVPLCANYVISERALSLMERNLYTAYELARMKPVTGHDTYCSMRATNTWVQAHLPNAFPAEPLFDGRAAEPHASHASAGPGTFLVRAARLLEPVLRSSVGGALERFEMGYRIRKRTRLEAVRYPGSESAWGRDWFKAHSTGHQARTLASFAVRLEQLGLARLDTIES